MIKENTRTSHIRQKSYHDKRRNALIFQEGNHVFLRVTRVIGVGWALKSLKHTPLFVGLNQILRRVGEVTYHSVFHFSQLHKYIPDSSHVIQSNDVEIRDNLTYETSLL